MNLVHEFLDAVQFHMIVEQAVLLEGGADNGAVSDGQNFLDGVDLAAGVGKDSGIGNGVLNPGRMSVSVAAPAVMPETQMTSGLLLNTVVLAICSMGRSARYLAASGTIFHSSFTFCRPRRI